ncbi:MAG: type II toxin-antitoxin system prevent-host-death family antitoxin [Burkholderiaceae bacterium]
MKIAATQFKAHALGLIDRVAQSREEVVITKHGKPMAKLVPIEDDAVPPVFGYLAGLVTREADIVSPVGEPWNAERE